MIDAIEVTTEALDTLLSGVFRLPLRKALNPNKDKDFVTIVDRLARDLTRRTWETEAYVLQRAIRDLRVDWARTSPQQQKKLLDAVKKKMRAALKRVEQQAREVLDEYAERIYEDTWRDVTGTNPKVTRETRESMRLWVLLHLQALRESYGTRWDRIALVALSTVAAGTVAGFASGKITQDVLTAIRDKAEETARTYWRVLSSVHANNVRGFANLGALDDSGIRTYRFEAVLDERTSEVCRFMHGRTFDVRVALDNIEAAVNAATPEEMAAAQPWVQSSGGRIYIRSGDKRTDIATIEEPGKGVAGRVGTYSTEFSDDELAALGVVVPPLHPHCRSTIVAVR